jgi:hypothetical protein
MVVIFFWWRKPEYSEKTTDIFILFSVQLHIAHLLEVQGKIKQAKEAYEHFITLEDIDKSVKATALKQLGNFSCAFYYRAL